jgi:ABC-type spermidine/putrescine transport system permease subunit II
VIVVAIAISSLFRRLRLGFRFHSMLLGHVAAIAVTVIL